jgi:hypothetical protein
VSILWSFLLQLLIVISGGFFHISSSGNTGNGTSNNTFSYIDPAGNTYNRKVNAALNNITFDHQSGTLAPGSQVHFPGIPLASLAGGGVRLPGGRQFRFLGL